MRRETRRILLLVLAAAAEWTLCAPPADPLDPLSVTFSCEERWCNESWRGDRILRYDLAVSYELRAESRTQHSGPVLDCMGGQVSENCVLEGSGTAVMEQLVKVVNRTLVTVEDIGEEGIIATDNFNQSIGELRGPYRGNQDKIWQIRIPQQCQLWIVFEEFDLEATADCEKDYFSVQTSKKQPDIRKYCSTLESITIQRRRRAQLWFHADDSVQRRGIFARYCFRRLATTNSSQQQQRLRCDCNLSSSHTRRRKRSSGTNETQKTTFAIAGATQRQDMNYYREVQGPLTPYSRKEMVNLFRLRNHPSDPHSSSYQQ